MYVLTKRGLFIWRPLTCLRRSGFAQAGRQIKKFLLCILGDSAVRFLFWIIA
jgi:hypothetical protein